jgi:hypothetical protein
MCANSHDLKAEITDVILKGVDVHPNVTAAMRALAAPEGVEGFAIEGFGKKVGGGVIFALRNKINLLAF